MKVSVLIGVVTIIASVFFITFILNTLIGTNIKCSAEEETLICEFRSLGAPIFFGLLFISGFVIIDALIAYIIIKNWFYITRLKIRYNEIKKMKDITEKNYYKKMIDEQTFKNLIQAYEKEMVELEVRMKKVK